MNGSILVNCEYDSISALKGVTNSLLTEKDGKYGICLLYTSTDGHL